jgi:pimeloyl-ACP methyl ester carboxylesterase
MELYRLIDAAVCRYTLCTPSDRRPLTYQGLYLAGGTSARLRAAAPDGNGCRPVLLLGGTSITLADQKELIAELLRSGLAVAAMQTPMGGPLAGGVAPRRMRPLCLADFLARLQQEACVRAVDVIAHSYAAFEVLRILLTAPRSYRRLIQSVLLVNPPGFEARFGFPTHCRRVVGSHILCGYMEMLLLRWGWRRWGLEGAAGPRCAFARREMRGIAVMTARGLKNVLRTHREMRDIVTFKIERPLGRLCTEHGYAFYLFLNAGDRMVAVRETLRRAVDLLPKENIRLVPGGHNDLLFQQWQRPAFLKFLHEIRARHPLGAMSG